ncbi:MAG: helix-hairpin-helix domain-containing protein [Desulfuromonadales bacterium]|nr:helix-hairpin-helix domain-containing protein [Desulfuromonadales bacterium]
MKMALLDSAFPLLDDSPLDSPLLTGSHLSVPRRGMEAAEIERKWLPAGQRIALGIALHPDRMERLDWESLPGIGPKLAQSIEEDRQKNGDFVALESLTRVKGIGPKRIDAFRPFF